MCELRTDFTKDIQYTGYKVVVKQNEKYFSPATGVEYIESVNVPRPKYQKRLAMVFSNNILSKTGGRFKENFFGKTAVFVYSTDAWDLKDGIDKNQKSYSEPILPIETAVVKMTLSKNLMEGYYGDAEIIAGEFIEKIEELK
jgi:ribosomal protein L10